MKKYRVRYVDAGQAVVHEALCMAHDDTTLRQEMSAQGRVVLSVTPALAQTLLAALRPQVQITRQAYSLFCREVRTLIQAGMTIVEAVETLSARERLEGQSHSLSALLLQRLQQGLSLSVALGELPDVPPVLQAAVRAGERTSNLAQALDDYLRFDVMVSQLRKKIVSAAIYPALVSLIGLAISIFLLLVVMPNFAAMYENLRGSAQGTTALTIHISQFLGKNRLLVFSVLGAVAGGIAWWCMSGLARQHLAQLGMRAPWVRRRIEDFQLALMYQALALLLRGGYPMTQAMDIAAKSALSSHFRSALLKAQEAIEQGGSVSQALADMHLCDEVGRRLMAAAERNGDFHRAADVVSHMHRERFELFVERATRIVEPVLLLMVALVVGGIVVMMYLPVFDMATQLQ